MSTRFWHMLLSLALMTGTAYCEVALTQPISHKPPLSFSSSLPSSPSSSVGATTRKSAVSDERQNYERTLLEIYRQRIIDQLGLNVNELGVVVRPNGTLTKRPPVGSDIVNANTPINISIDGERGELLTV